MVEEFGHKANFLQGIKDNNKVNTKNRSMMSETYQNFVKGSLDHGDLPLPILNMIKKGLLYIPDCYPINEGVAYAMRKTLKNIENINKY